eukprot:g7123.t1
MTVPYPPFRDEERLASTTSGTLYICVECMPQGFRYNMRVSVTSRWGLTAMKRFVIEKADYPTSSGIRIDTEIRQSECAVGDQQLSCSWECESHNPDWVPDGVSQTMECGNELFEPEKLEFPVYGQTLAIPRYTLSPPLYSSDDMQAGIQKFHEFRFRIVCVVVQSATDVTAQTETQQGQNAAELVIIRIERAPLKVILFPSGTEDWDWTRQRSTEWPTGRDLEQEAAASCVWLHLSIFFQHPTAVEEATTAALNARFTMDPDMESVYLCLLDPGSLACSTLPDFGYNGYFTFRCWKVTPSASASGGDTDNSGDTVCPGDNYVLRDVNTLCEEGTEVTDATTCETAAGQCGPYTWSSFDANSPAEMGGCFFRTVEGDVQYNTFGVRTVD